MRKPSRPVLFAALLASLFAVGGPVASPASAQTAPGYYDVPQATASEGATNLRDSAKKSLAKLSYRSLGKGTKSIKVEITGHGVYSLKIFYKRGGKSTLVARGAVYVPSDATETATIKLKPTLFGKKFLKKQKGKTLKLNAESSFTPGGAKSATVKKSTVSLKR